VYVYYTTLVVYYFSAAMPSDEGCTSTVLNT